MQDCERQLVELFGERNKQSDVAPKYRVFVCLDNGNVKAVEFSVCHYIVIFKYCSLLLGLERYWEYENVLNYAVKNNSRSLKFIKSFQAGLVVVLIVFYSHVHWLCKLTAPSRRRR